MGRLLSRSGTLKREPDAAAFQPLRPKLAPTSLLRSPASASPTTLAGDSFAGTAATSLSGRSSDRGTAQTWTVVSGTWQIDGSGHVSPTAATDGLLAVMPLPAAVSSSYSVSLDVVIGKSGASSISQGLVFRYVDSSNYWYFQAPPSGGNNWQVYKVVAGTHTQVLQFGITKTNGTTVTMRLDIWGRDVTVYLDGVEIYTIVDATNAAVQKIGLRQGISGGFATPGVFSNLRVTSYASAKLNVPRLDASPSVQVIPHGTAGSWDDTDDNNPNVVWDPVNNRWVLYYSGFTSASSSTIQGMGLAYADSLDGPWTKDPSNPVVPAATGNVENGALIYHFGRWIKVEDGGGWYTSSDLHTWTPLTVFGIAPIGDPFLRVNENGLLEVWYGNAIPATAIMRQASADGGVTWDPAVTVLSIPAYLTTRGHGEPSVWVPPGKEGVEAIVFVDTINEGAGHGVISAVVTVDGGTTWHWHQIAGGSGSGFDSFQKFDSFPVGVDPVTGVFYLFHSGAPLPGGEVNLDSTIGRMAVQFTQTPVAGTYPVPYQ